MQPNFTNRTSTVLIIDNDPDVIAILKAQLSEEGMDVKTCAGINNISQLLADVKPDLLIIDYLLHAASGGELCREIKTSARSKNLPVIILSAYPRVVIPKENLSCNLLIQKPFNIKKLAAQVKLLMFNYKHEPIRLPVYRSPMIAC